MEPEQFRSALAVSLESVFLSMRHEIPAMRAAGGGAIVNLASTAGLEAVGDSEYRYVGRPLPALQGLDQAGRVVYVGSFSKVLFPSLRVGYLVVPDGLVDAFTAAQRFGEVHVPALEQAALADFLADGHLGRHVRRMRACTPSAAGP